MILVYPNNADYLIEDVRLHIGDIESTPRYSDAVIRSSILSAVRMLQRYWKQRYLVFRSSMVVDPVPSDVTVPSGYMYVKVPEGYGFAPIGLVDNDIFRNPFYTFADPGSEVFSQEDEWPVILAATVVLTRLQLAGSASVFQNWSDGEYSFSNVASSNSLRDLYATALKQFEDYFKKKLAVGVRASFPEFIP